MEDILIILYPRKTQGTFVMKYGRGAWCINWEVLTLLSEKNVGITKRFYLANAQTEDLCSGKK